HAAAIDETPFWKVWFGGEYRRAVRAHNRLYRQKVRTTRDEMSQNLRAIADHLHKRLQFESGHPCRDIVGSHFRGLDTPWGDFCALATWYDEVFLALPEGDHGGLWDLLLRSRADRLRTIRVQAAAMEGERDAL